MSSTAERDVFFVSGDHGILTVDAETGTLVDNDVEGEYGNIDYFDVEEWKVTYPDETLINETIDILDIGYWTLREGYYEEPDYKWRNEYRGPNHRRA